MNRGASVRRFSRYIGRATGIVSTTALLCVAAGSLGTAAAATPYPPTPPCALSWSQNSAAQDVLVGSGYDSGRPVALTLYPQAQSLGTPVANSAGAFQVPVAVDPGTFSWVTATSVTRSCSVSGPGGGSGSGGGTSSTGGAPSSSGQAPAGGSGPAGTGTTNSGGSGAGGSHGSGASGAGSSAGVGTSSSPYPPTGGSGASSGGSGTSVPTTSAPSRAPSRADAPAAALGLPVAAIVGIAALLLLTGGIAVLFLTRRAG